MVNIRNIFEKLLLFFRVRAAIDGLEISDSAVRFARFDGEHVFTASVPLPQGTLASGQVKDQEAFVESLRALHAEIAGSSRRRKINVAVSLSSADIYSHVFSLPFLEGGSLEKAIELNLKMVSPTNMAETYSGWQEVSRDLKISKVEVMAAFVQKSIVDEIIRALSEAGFFAHSVEPRALALIRLLRELGMGFDVAASYILVTATEAGFEFLIIRNGQFYFQYFVSWRDVQAENKEITQEAFDKAVIRSMHQVLNFYNAHWPERLAGIFVMPTGVEGEITRVIGENFPIKILEMAVRLPETAGSEWFVAMGSGLRNKISHSEDYNMSLLGISASKEFRRHQLLDFMRFWRLLIPLALAIVLVLFIGADVFFSRTEQSLGSQASGAVSPDQIKEMRGLEAQAKEFNRSVDLITGILESASPKTGVLDMTQSAFSKNNITVNQISIQENAVSVSALALNESQIPKLKKTLEETGAFENISIPFSEIKPTTQGFSFTVSFSVIPAKTE